MSEQEPLSLVMWSLDPCCEVWGYFVDFWPCKVHFLESSLLSRCFTCIIHDCQIFENSKTQLGIQGSHCSFSWGISLWVYLWLSADVFRHCCTEKGLFGCKKPGSWAGLHTEVRTSSLLLASVFPLFNILLFPLLLWIEFLKFIPVTWLMIRIQSFTAMLNIFFFNVQSTILISM